MTHPSSAAIGICGLALAGFVPATPGMAQEPAVDDIAVAVRDAGHACTDPKDAKPDPARSLPDEAAWTLRCDEGSYSIRFEGDTGATVRKLDR